MQLSLPASLPAFSFVITTEDDNRARPSNVLFLSQSQIKISKLEFQSSKADLTGYIIEVQIQFLAPCSQKFSIRLHPSQIRHPYGVIGKLLGPTMISEIWRHSSWFSKLFGVEKSISGIFSTQNGEKMKNEGKIGRRRK